MNNTDNQKGSAPTKGYATRSIMHWSIDELVEYKASGKKPQTILDPDKIYLLAKNGLSIPNIGKIFDLSKTQFHKDEAYMSAYNRGVAELGAMVRARMVDEALDQGNFQALMYLDKKFGGDDTPQEVVITHRPLETADTSELLFAIQSCKPV